MLRAGYRGPAKLIVFQTEARLISVGEFASDRFVFYCPRIIKKKQSHKFNITHFRCPTAVSVALLKTTFPALLERLVSGLAELLGESLHTVD